MTTLSQLKTLRGKIDRLEGERLDTKEALATAQAPVDIAFLSQRVLDLNEKKILLREQETILLQVQVSGEQCLPHYLCH